MGEEQNRLGKIENQFNNAGGAAGVKRAIGYATGNAPQSEDDAMKRRMAKEDEQRAQKSVETNVDSRLRGMGFFNRSKASDKPKE